MGPEQKQNQGKGKHLANNTKGHNLPQDKQTSRKLRAMHPWTTVTMRMEDKRVNTHVLTAPSREEVIAEELCFALSKA